MATGVEEPFFSDDEQREEEEDLQEESEEEDEEEDDEDENGDDGGVEKSRRNRKRPTQETKLAKAPRHKRHRASVRGFLDVEAAVGDDDEEEEDEGDEFFDEADEAHLAERELDMSHRRRFNQEAAFQSRGETIGGAGHLASAIGNLERRFQDQTYQEGLDEDEEVDEDLGGDYGISSYSEYEAHGDDPSRFIPDTTDAKLWVVKVAKGASERGVIVSIMNKCLIYAKRGLPFPLLSAFAADGVKGHIYIESESPGKIREALSGLRSVALGQVIKMVPIREMCSVFLMGDREIRILPRGEWVRVKNGLHAGDLGQVVDHDSQTNVVTVRLIPRVDFNEAIERYKSGERKRGSGLGMEKMKQRPVARFFDREEIEMKGCDCEPGPVRGTLKFDGKTFEDSGYIWKKIRAHLLLTKDEVRATPHEVKDFSARLGDQEDLQGLDLPPPSARPESYAIGDVVSIQSGDVAGLKGTIQSVDVRSGTVVVQSLDQRLASSVSVTLNDVVKYFDVGASVRAFVGPNEGNAGLVTAIDLRKKTATVFSPSLGRPFVCCLEDLKSCGNSGLGSGGISCLGGFSVGDLVQLSHHHIGVVVRIDPAKTFSVLTTEGKIEDVALSGIATKRSSEFSSTIDVNRVQFGTKATVALLEAPYKGQVGRVVHIWKQRVFVKLPAKDDHRGIVVVDGRQVKVSSGDGGFNPFALNNPYGQHVGGATERPPPSGQQGSGGGRGFVNRGGRGRGGGYRGGRGGRGLIGQRLKIISGHYKGSFGDITSIDDNIVRARLVQSSKELQLPRDDVMILGTSGNFGGGNFNKESGTLSRAGRGYNNDATYRRGGAPVGNSSWDNYFQKAFNSGRSSTSNFSPSDGSNFNVSDSSGSRDTSSSWNANRTQLSTEATNSAWRPTDANTWNSPTRGAGSWFTPNSSSPSRASWGNSNSSDTWGGGGSSWGHEKRSC